MTIEPGEFQDRLRTLLGVRGAVLTDQELAQVADCYPRCQGRDTWDVRQYVQGGQLGAREYRVVRGSSVQDVFRSAERARATLVETALNELESQGTPGGAEDRR